MGAEDEYATDWGAPAPSGAAAFDVVLEQTGRNKIAVIKEIRRATRLDLRAAKELADSRPSVVAAAMPREQAEAIRAALERAGAAVSLTAAAGPRIFPASETTARGRRSGMRVVSRLAFVLVGLGLAAVGYQTVDRSAGWGIALFVLGLFTLVVAGSVGRRGA